MLKKFDQKITEGILFTDQYQLMMAQLYFKLGIHEKPAQFDHFFRSYPDYGNNKAGYCVNAGLEWLVDWMENTRTTEKDIELLKNQKSRSGKNLFENDFLNWFLKNGNFNSLNLKAIPEGRIVHPNEPLTEIKGPIAMAQILETALLNQLNFHTLIATKASRIKEAGKCKLLLEFGTRRAQDRGAIAGARAALIGGADFTSNVGIAELLGIQAKGTHAHSLIQLFLAMGESEFDAFDAFAELYPDDSILLVDTIDTLNSGIPNAIKVFERLKKKGHKPFGIRLDSGDLAYLSVQAAKMLNDAGFPEVKIVLSNELDEIVIWQILTQISEEAPKLGLKAEEIFDRFIFGVGTKLITSEGDAALGGVYKLSAVYHEKNWQPAIKISEVPQKTPIPGDKEVYRIYGENGKATVDLISLEDENPFEKDEIEIFHPWDKDKKRKIKKSEIKNSEKLIVDILEEGNLKYDFPPIEELRNMRENDIQKLDSGVRRMINPHVYHVSLTENLMKLKLKLMNKFKK